MAQDAYDRSYANALAPLVGISNDQRALAVAEAGRRQAIEDQRRQNALALQQQKLRDAATLDRQMKYLNAQNANAIALRNDQREYDERMRVQEMARLKGASNQIATELQSTIDAMNNLRLTPEEDAQAKIAYIRNEQPVDANGNPITSIAELDAAITAEANARNNTEGAVLGTPLRDSIAEYQQMVMVEKIKPLAQQRDYLTNQLRSLTAQGIMPDASINWGGQQPQELMPTDGVQDMVAGFNEQQSESQPTNKQPSGLIPSALRAVDNDPIGWPVRAAGNLVTDAYSGTVGFLWDKDTGDALNKRYDNYWDTVNLNKIGQELGRTAGRSVGERTPSQDTVQLNQDEIALKNPRTTLESRNAIFSRYSDSPELQSLIDERYPKENYKPYRDLVQSALNPVVPGATGDATALMGVE